MKSALGGRLITWDWHRNEVDEYQITLCELADMRC